MAEGRFAAATERLMRYWAEGEGAARIRWGTDGDHTRCVRLIQKEIVEGGDAPLPDRVIHGLCTNLQKRAVGYAGEKRGDG